MLANHTINANLLSLPYALSLFLYGLLEAPRPGARSCALPNPTRTQAPALTLTLTLIPTLALTLTPTLALTLTPNPNQVGFEQTDFRIIVYSQTHAYFKEGTRDVTGDDSMAC